MHVKTERFNNHAQAIGFYQSVCRERARAVLIDRWDRWQWEVAYTFHPTAKLPVEQKVRNENDSDDEILAIYKHRNMTRSNRRTLEALLFKAKKLNSPLNKR